jgi:hypothetical protein
MSPKLTKTAEPYRGLHTSIGAKEKAGRVLLAPAADPRQRSSHTGHAILRSGSDGEHSTPLPATCFSFCRQPKYTPLSDECIRFSFICNRPSVIKKSNPAHQNFHFGPRWTALDNK